MNILSFPTLSRPALLVTLALIGCASAYGASRYLIARNDSETTNDAFVSADYTLISPKVSGFVHEVLVDDNQLVRAGQLLASIDDGEYRAALDAARADVAKARAQLATSKAMQERQRSVIRQAIAAVEATDAELVFAGKELARYQHLASVGAGTQQNAQQARTRLDVSLALQAQNRAAVEAARKQSDVLVAEREAAAASLAHALAAQQRADLDLSHTRLAAPVDGVVGRRAVRVGNLVAPGPALLAIVPLQNAYVIANFQENQLRRIRAGQHVIIHVDTYASADWSGTVQSIAPATGVTFSAVAPDNATGNFTKVVQRIPVKIALDQGRQRSDLLRVGMSVEVTVDTRSQAVGSKG